MVVSFKMVEGTEGTEVVDLRAYLDIKGGLESGPELDTTSESEPGPSEGGVYTVTGFTKPSLGTGALSTFSTLEEKVAVDD